MSTKESRIADSKIKNKAKEILMKKYNIPEDTAYHILQKTAMSHRVSIIDLAKQVIKDFDK